MIMLVVDDDRLNLKVAEELLHTLYPDSHVMLCQNPLEVPALLEANEVDILFLDIIMPQRSGMDVLDDIRSDSRFNDMPIIMLAIWACISSLGFAISSAAFAICSSIRAAISIPNQPVGIPRSGIADEMSSRLI